MKNYISLLLFILLSINPIIGQGFSYPKGIYKSFEELVNKTPSLIAELEVVKRTKGDIQMNGGNDYKLISSDKSIKKNLIKRKIHAYSDGNILYINGGFYGCQPWFTPLLSDGKRYLVIKGGISPSPQISQNQLKNKSQFGNSFGAIGGGIQGAKLATLRFIYVIDKENRMIESVTVDYLEKIISKKPALLDEYNKEKDKANQELFLKYVTLLNQSRK